MKVVNFKDYKVNFEKLLSYGFIQYKETYKYQVPIVENQFELSINILEKHRVETKVIDINTNEEYILHEVPDASGEFVGRVSDEYQKVLEDVKQNCFDKDVFRNEQPKSIIKYINENYNNELEFLWKKFPQNAIWRRTDTNKWYGLLMNMQASKLGVEPDEIVTVLGMRANSGDIEKLVDNKTYFPGYHMSKKTWYTIILNGTVDDQEIFARLQKSYELAK